MFSLKQHRLELLLKCTDINFRRRIVSNDDFHNFAQFAQSEFGQTLNFKNIMVSLTNYIPKMKLINKVYFGTRLKSKSYT